MDKWTPDSLSCEDAKRILQGIDTLHLFRYLKIEWNSEFLVKFPFSKQLFFFSFKVAEFPFKGNIIMYRVATIIVASL